MGRRVFANNPRDFDFTPGQKEKLFKVLIRGPIKSRDALAHKEFFRQTRKWTGIWIEALGADIDYIESSDTFTLNNFSLEPRDSEHRKPINKLLKATNDLKSQLENLPGFVAPELTFNLTNELQTQSPRCLKEAVLNYRKFDMDMQDLPIAPTYLINDLLDLLQKSCQLVLEDHQDKGGYHNPILKHLIILLAEKYQEIYGVEDLGSQTGPFYKYMSQIAEIFSQSISVGLTQNVLKKQYLTD